VAGLAKEALGDLGYASIDARAGTGNGTYGNRRVSTHTSTRDSACGNQR
jgi:hypothetical protein